MSKEMIEALQEVDREFPEVLKNLPRVRVIEGFNPMPVESHWMLDLIRIVALAATLVFSLWTTFVR